MDKTSIQIEDLLSVSNIDEINSLISQLSSEERAELMQKMLGKSGLMVVLGGSNVTTSDLVIQIHSTANLDLSDLLRAIATRIVDQKPSKEKEQNGEQN